MTLSEPIQIGASGPSDEELVVRARSGDRWARELLFRRHVPAVTATVTRLLRTRAGAEDVVQDTFVRAFAALDGLRNPAALRSWLLRIAVHEIHGLFRKRKLLRILGLASPTTEESLAKIAGTSASPEIVAELALIDRALSRIREKDRIAWMLRYVEGEELTDIAEIIGCSLATAKRRIQAAELSLSAHLEMEDAR